MNVATGRHYLPLAPSYHRTATQPGQGQGLIHRLHGPATVTFNPVDRHPTHHPLHQLICNQSNISLSPSVTPPSPVNTRAGNAALLHGYQSNRPNPCNSTSFMLQANQNNTNVHRAFLTPTSVVKFGSMLESSAVAACHRVHGRQLSKCSPGIERYTTSSTASLCESQHSPPYQQQVMAAASFQRTAHRLAELGLLDPRNRVHLAALSLYHHHQQQYAVAAAAMPYMTSLFTQSDLDMALYGYTKSRGSPPTELSLSGLRINELSYSMDRILSGCIQTTKCSAASRPDPASVELPEGLVLRDETFGGVIHYGVFCGPNTYIMPRTRYGPFPGKQVNTSEIKTNDDNSFMWEIFKDGRLSHFIDGRGPTGNWMSYVNCARHPREQNLAAIQIDGHIYYEVCCELKPGSELLVWYDTEFYVQFMGVPISIRDNSAEMTSSTIVDPAADSDVKRQPAIADDCESNAGYQCERCGKVFAYQYYRDKHLKYTRCVDQGDRKFPCHLCSRSFEKRDRLRIHILHVHEKHRPHKCVVCAKSFSQSSSLNKHMRVHSGERPYKCVYCSKAFTASSILRTHIRQHSGEKPFKCKHCGKPFASHAAHDSHVRRTHAKMVTSLTCNICGRTFTQAYELEFHLQSHDGIEYAADDNHVMSFSDDSYSPRDLELNENCDEAIDVVGGVERSL